jgi:hypothetical protein
MVALLRSECSKATMLRQLAGHAPGHAGALTSSNAARIASGSTTDSAPVDAVS